MRILAAHCIARESMAHALHRLAPLVAEPEPHQRMSGLDEKPAVEAAADSTPEQKQEQSAAIRLFKAVNDGELGTVKQLLPAETAEAASDAASAAASSSAALTVASAKPLSVNITDSAGFTPLIAAARLGREDVVRYLLTLPGIDVNARTAHYNTALLYAAGKGSVTIVRTLLEAGADFFHRNVNGDSVLALSCISGDVATVQFIISAYHDIQTAKAAHAHGSQLSHRKWFTNKNEEGLTALMCGTMSGSEEIVKLILKEVRRELGVNLPASQLDPSAGGHPSAQREFYPSLDVLGPIQFDSNLASGYVDPAPPAFLAHVNAQTLTGGDTAAHIAAESQNLPLYFLLVDNAGADHMKLNRRGRRTFELFKEPSDDSDDEAAAPAAAAASAKAASTSSSSSSTPVQDAVSAHLFSLLQFQRRCREEYARVASSHSEKLFAELMDEEEEAQARSAARGSKNKKSGANAAGKKKAGGAKKKSAAALAAEPATITLASDSDEPSSPASSPRLAPVAVASSSSTSAAAAPALSPAAAPFVPLAVQAAADAASGWETVAPKAAKHAAVKEKSKPAPAAAPAAVAEKKKPSASPVPTPATAAAASAPVPHASPAKAKSEGKSKSRKSNTAATSHPPVAATNAPAAATAAPVAAPAVPAAAAPAVAAPAAPVPYTLVPVATPAAAVEPTPSSSFFAGFNSRPRAWRPITALNPRRSPLSMDAAAAAGAGAGAASPNAASSSADDQLASLQSQFSSLHPHIESTDLHVQHLLGAEWSSLSMSQLAVLDDVLSALTRQLRDAQANHAQLQLQELSNEMQRTRSELSVLRREVQVLKAKQQE